MNEHKRLYRSRSDRQIAGICGGLAQHFEVDPTIVRLAFIVIALMGGPGLVIYIILAFVIPEEPDPYLSEKPKNQDTSSDYIHSDYGNSSSYRDDDDHSSSYSDSGSSDSGGGDSGGGDSD